MALKTIVINKGQRGNSVLNGTGVPSVTVGINGDFYIDTAADLIYGPKAGGVWGAGTFFGGSGGATTALDNLASVEINAELAAEAGLELALSSDTGIILSGFGGAGNYTPYIDYYTLSFKVLADDNTSNHQVYGSLLDLRGPQDLSTVMTLQIYDLDQSNFIGLKIPDVISGSYTLTLPGADGSSGQVLSTDGSGILSWVSASGGGANTSLSNLITTAINADLIGNTGGNWNIQTTDDNGGAQILVLHGGDELGTSADGNSVLVRGGHSTGNYAGNAIVNGGENVGTGNGGAAQIQGGNSVAADGGAVSIFGGFGPLNGGPIQIYGGDSSGTRGSVSIDGLYVQVGVGAAVGAVPLRFYDDAGTNYISIEAPSTIASSFNLIYPNQLGAPGSVLTDVAGDGILSFESPTGGGANTSLSNLITTNINQNLIGNTDPADAVSWYIQTENRVTQGQSIILASGHVTAGTDSAGIAYVQGGNAFGGQAGSVGLLAGNSTNAGASGNGGNADVSGGGALGSGNGGHVNISGGGANGAGAGGQIFLQGGAFNGFTEFAGILAISTEGLHLRNNAYFTGIVPLRFYDEDDSNYVGFKAPAVIASDLIWTLPDADGTAGQVLSTDGSGVLSWATVSGGGGATTELDNLTTTAINADLIGDTGATWQLQTKDDLAGTQVLAVHSGDVLSGSGTPGILVLRGGHGYDTSGAEVIVNGGEGLNNGNGGNASLFGGASLNANGGSALVSAGNSNVTGNGGDVYIQSGSAASGNGGIIYISAGTGTGTNGSINITSDKTEFSTGYIQLPAVNTAGGDTGDKTINTISGKVNFAAAAQTLTVTNNKVTTASSVFPSIMTNDATATSAQVVAAAGSFTIYLNAPATAETAVAFLVVNQ